MAQKETRLDLDTTQRAVQPGSSQDRRAGASLVIIRGEPFAKVFQLGDEPVTVGRAADCDIQFGLENVSRRHCRIWLDGARFRIRDLGATNRTLVNGRPIDEAVLEDADRVTVGDVVLKFVDGDSLEAEYHSEAYARATEDPLTGIANRRLFEEVLTREADTCLRHGQPLSLCLIDVDHFKTVNDRYDHTVGDRVLVHLSELLRGSARELDTIARVGGEEFAVLLPGTDLQEAARYAREQRARVAAEPFLCDGHRVPVTISVGVAEYGLRMHDPWQLFKAADRALVTAKQSGRDRVCLARDEPA